MESTNTEGRRTTSPVQSRLDPSVLRLLRARRHATETHATEKLGLLRRLERQKVIRDLPESRVEQSFNEQLFARILGYRTLLSHEGAGFDLLPKNPTGPRRFDDFSLGVFGEGEDVVLASAEFKGPGADLDAPQVGGKHAGQTPVEQAFAAIAGNGSCRWVIVSNFRELRLYVASDPHQPLAVADLHEVRTADDLASLCAHFDRHALLIGTQLKRRNPEMSQALDEDFPGRPLPPAEGFYRAIIRFTPTGESVIALNQLEGSLRSAVENAPEKATFWREDHVHRPIVITMRDGWVWTDGAHQQKHTIRIAIDRFGQIVASARLAREQGLGAIDWDVQFYWIKFLVRLFLRVTRELFQTDPLALGGGPVTKGQQQGVVGMELHEVAEARLLDGPPNAPRIGKSPESQLFAGDFSGNVPFSIINGVAMCLAELAIQFRGAEGGVVMDPREEAKDLLTDLNRKE